MKTLREGYGRLKTRKERICFFLITGFIVGTGLLLVASLVSTLGWFGFLGALVFFGAFVGLFWAMGVLAKSDL